MTQQLNFDALVPAEMARRAEYIGTRKTEMSAGSMFVLAILAGAFIGFGAIFATTVATGTSGMLPFGISKLLIGLVFCLGLVLVVIAGAELFTGNNLIVMAWASGKVTTRALLRNWGIVYLGNFVGSVATSVIMFFTKQYTFAEGAVGVTALNIADGKVNLEFGQAIALGIMCNVLVCLAVWLTFSARSAVDKVAVIVFPITAFVAAGFEHSIANMYFITIGLFIKGFDGAFVTARGLEFSNLTLENFLFANLLPVTIGNIIGGALMVAIVYWAIYLRTRDMSVT